MIRPIPAAHHRLLIDKLEAVERGDCRRLMVFMPPGSAKSSYASVVFPTWFMGRAKRRNVIVATYASDLARKIGRRSRSILRQPVYRSIFKTGLSSETAAMDEWALENENEFMGGGILSGITGNRADCLRGDSVVETEGGPKAIKELVDSAFSGKVLSYDQYSGQVVYRSVQAVARRPSPDFYRVLTAAGRVVECTGDHRLYTSRGYVEARLLALGDILLSALPSGSEAPGVLHAQGRAQRDRAELLRPQMPAVGHKQASKKDRAVLPDMQNQNGPPSPNQALLLRRLSRGRVHEQVEKSKVRYAGTSVRDLQQGLSTHQSVHAGTFLFAPLQGFGARSGRFSGKEPRMAERRESIAAGRPLRAGLSRAKATGIGAGRVSVRGVRSDREATCASHRHECAERSMGEPRYPLREMPHEAAWRGEAETAGDPVAVVERVYEPTEVYDIQVEGTHCFFANGILVHNCIIIDDPIKGRQQADSEATRESTRAAYDDDLKTRLKPGGRIVLIQTRWHAADLAGSILPEDYSGQSGPVACRDGETWEVLSIPAQALENDPLGRRPGEMLWPEWFDDRHWAAFRSNPRTWSALYQQNPSPDDGTYFQKAWFKRWRVKPANLHVYMTSDHATKEDAGDFTVFRVWGIDPQGDLYLLDGFKEQTTTDKWMKRGVDLIKKWKPLCWFPENDQAWRAVAPFVQRYMYETRVNCRREPLPTSGDKPTKARAFQAMASMGRVYLPETPEGDAILNEYLRFPAGKHDDEIDAAAAMGLALDEAHPAIVKSRAAVNGPSDRYTRARPEGSTSDNDWMVA